MNNEFILNILEMGVVGKTYETKFINADNWWSWMIAMGVCFCFCFFTNLYFWICFKFSIVKRFKKKILSFVYSKSLRTLPELTFVYLLLDSPHPELLILLNLPNSLLLDLGSWRYSTYSFFILEQARLPVFK